MPHKQFRQSGDKSFLVDFCDAVVVKHGDRFDNAHRTFVLGVAHASNCPLVLQWDGHGTLAHKMTRIVDSLLLSHEDDVLSRQGSERSDTTELRHKLEPGRDATPQSAISRSTAFDDVVAKEL